jgi:hypothetical protein
MMPMKKNILKSFMLFMSFMVKGIGNQWIM